MRITRLAAPCLLAVPCLLTATACGAGHDGAPATPVPATSRVDKEQTIAQPDAEVLFGRIRAAESAPPVSPSPVPASSEPVSRASARPSPAPSVEQYFEGRVFPRGQSTSVPNPGSGPGHPR